MLHRMQGLRAVAAYMVVADHIQMFVRLHIKSPIHVYDIGSSGVDLFFVISGFIMMHVSGEQSRPDVFLFNRITRIVPVYWLMTGVAILAFAIAPWTFGQGLVNAQTVLSSLFFIPCFDMMHSLKPILFVGWTLDFEMMFYVLFALAMFAPRRHRMWVLLGLMTVVLVVGRLAPKDSPLSFDGNPIIYEFAAGCLIGLVARNPAWFAVVNRIPPWIYIGLGVAGLLASVPFPQPEDDFRELVWGMPAALIVLGVVMLDLTRPEHHEGFVEKLGDASYSAYLIHVFVVQFAGIHIFKALGANPESIAVLVVVGVAGTMVASLLSYRLIEVPSRSFLRRLARRRRPAVATETLLP